MMHAYFSTNIKHGATYALQDLLASSSKVITFVGSSVIGTKSWLVFPRCLKPVFWKPCSFTDCFAHDLQEDHRAEEGSEKKTYEFLLTAARRYLDRERLESNRERVARTLGASSSSAAPAVGEKTGYIPKGYCVKWNTGTCTNDSCTFKHGKPLPKKDRSQSRPSSERGRSPSRDRNGQKKKKTSFGNKADAIEEANAVLVMRGNNPSRPVLPLLPGHPQMTRKDLGGRTAGVPAEARIVLQDRMDHGVPGIAAPQRGTKAKLRRLRHPQLQCASSHQC